MFSYDNKDHDRHGTLIQTQAGGYAFVSEKNENSDLWVVKTYVNGLILWNQTLGEQGDEESSSIVETPGAELVITGATT